MFKNYFKISWRNLWKNRFYSAINISGLAVGLATGIMLLLWVQNELSYDKFHPKYKDIYQLSAHFQINGEDVTWTGVPGPLSVYSKKIPQVKSLVRINKDFGQVITDVSKKKVIDGNTTAVVDSGFFRMFNFPLVAGNQKDPLPGLNTALLTETTAKKIFGDEDPVGKSIIYYDNTFTVTGVLKDFPENSTLHFDAVFPMAFYAKLFTEWGGNGSWTTIDEDVGNYAFDTYALLQPDAHANYVGEAFSKAYKEARNGDSGTEFRLQPLEDIHLTGADGNVSALRMVQIFLLVVVLLLVIASINYVNLSTARALARAKEVSIRKIVGAEKRQLFFQFTLETCILFSFALVLAVLLIYLLMPLYNNISGKQLVFTFNNPAVWKAIGMATFGTLAASSIYPALLLSSFNPIASLKGKFSTSAGSSVLRKGLVVFQFVISIVLLICTVIMGNQMNYMRNKDLGFDKNYVFTVNLPRDAGDHKEAVITELKRNPAVVNLGISSASNINEMSSSTGDINWPGKPETDNMIISQLYADENFIPTMRMKFIEGGNFTGTPADSAYYILNETAVKRMGLKAPYVGQQISFHDRKGTIKGVVKDFNFQSLKEKITPLIMYHFWNNGNVLYVRTNPQKAQNAIAATESQFKKYAGVTPFSYRFVDDAFDKLYQTEQRSKLLFNIFAGIAIFISCLGLFGLSTYTAQVKTKEIGIRKVLGATAAGIVSLISKDFLKLVALALIIAIPVAWWAISKWLEGFAFRTDISWWVFAFAGTAALIVAFATISIQSLRAASANPVKSLRDE